MRMFKVVINGLTCYFDSVEMAKAAMIAAGMVIEEHRIMTVYL